MLINTGLPEVSVHPPSQNVEETDTAKFTTKVSGIGQQSFNYQWKHNGERMEGETGDTLTVHNVTKDHDGTYQCVVRNEYDDCATSNTVELG